MTQRTFEKRSLHICYNTFVQGKGERLVYQKLRSNALKNKIDDFVVPKRSGKAWRQREGDICRITLTEGPQFQGKTRQIHSGHLTTYDRLWSSLPYLRPMATIVADSVQYGTDEDGAGIHDVMGTRCDPYTVQKITGQWPEVTCHQSLINAIEPFGLTEEHVHDVFNIFMCSGWTKDTVQYFVKGTPAKKGDYIEFIAEMDLLVALSVCPQGDVSLPVGVTFPEEKCFPLGVQIYRSSK
ncbi:uncharacterized protein C11D3.03c-like [Limulus polyphemus]|uniref:Uncharacterized protein C11D3.03c-like n=1 Tax=Limulus polyphemus TaxID=6850 RepID=A0ABM1TS08_LIMPO|nr:uncharacterized protein C11D3.03c-like [Limulus polyphemus]